MHIIRQELRRALLSWVFFACVCVYLGIMVYEVWDDYTSAVAGSYDMFTLYDYANSVSYLVLILPVLTALPYSMMFAQEWNSEYIRFLWMRLSPEKYCVSKCIACSVSGGMGLAVPSILYMVIFGSHLGWVSTDTIVHYSSMLPLMAWGPYAYLAIRVLCIGLFGAFCALFSLAVSAFVLNAPLALCIPFVTLRLWLYTLVRFNLPDELNILSLSKGTIELTTWTAPQILLYIIAVFCGLSIVCGLCFYFGVRRRYQNA